MNRHYGFLFPLILFLALFVTGCSCDKEKDTMKEEVMVEEEVDLVVSVQPEEKAFNGIRIHFQRPDGWGEPNIYAVGEQGASSDPYAGEWPGTKMIPEGNDWYVFTVDNVDQATIIFNDGNRQIPKANWPLYDAEREKGEWWFDGSWHDSPPEDS